MTRPKHEIEKILCVSNRSAFGRRVVKLTNGEFEYQRLGSDNEWHSWNYADKSLDKCMARFLEYVISFSKLEQYWIRSKEINKSSQ